MKKVMEVLVMYVLVTVVFWSSVYFPAVEKICRQHENLYLIVLLITFLIVGTRIGWIILDKQWWLRGLVYLLPTMVISQTFRVWSEHKSLTQLSVLPSLLFAFGVYIAMGFLAGIDYFSVHARRRRKKGL